VSEPDEPAGLEITLREDGGLSDPQAVEEMVAAIEYKLSRVLPEDQPSGRKYIVVPGRARAKDAAIETEVRESLIVHQKKNPQLVQERELAATNAPDKVSHLRTDTIEKVAEAIRKLREAGVSLEEIKRLYPHLLGAAKAGNDPPNPDPEVGHT